MIQNKWERFTFSTMMNGGRQIIPIFKKATIKLNKIILKTTTSALWKSTQDLRQTVSSWKPRKFGESCIKSVVLCSHFPCQNLSLPEGTSLTWCRVSQRVTSMLSTQGSLAWGCNPVKGKHGKSRKVFNWKFWEVRQPSGFDKHSIHFRFTRGMQNRNWNWFKPPTSHCCQGVHIHTKE